MGRRKAIARNVLLGVSLARAIESYAKQRGLSKSASIRFLTIRALEQNAQQPFNKIDDRLPGQDLPPNDYQPSGDRDYTYITPELLERYEAFQAQHELDNLSVTVRVLCSVGLLQESA